MPPEEPPSPDLPTLEHGVPGAETYLPDTPLWVWIVVASAFILIIAFGIWLYFRFRKPPLPTPPPPPNHYNRAVVALNQLQASLESRPLNEVASEASLILRTYFAASFAEPALYQTAEEFQARQAALPKEAATLLHDLNAAKYSRSTIDPQQANSFLENSLACLKTINAARNVTS